jgi:D-ribose pyranase
MKKKGIINAQLARIIASAGHFDKIAICDAGFPIPKGIEIVDLAIITGLPRFIDVMDAVLDELFVEECLVAEELLQQTHEVLGQIKERLPGIRINTVPHSDFKKVVGDVKAVIRTGECQHFCNVIFQCGVVF